MNEAEKYLYKMYPKNDNQSLYNKWAMIEFATDFAIHVEDKQWNDFALSQFDKTDKSNLLPSDEEIDTMAVDLSEHLTAPEQSFFIAGFQECIKWLRDNYQPKEIDLDELRTKFFDECTDIVEESLPDAEGLTMQKRKINMHPHDLFEWFRGRQKYV